MLPFNFLLKPPCHLQDLQHKYSMQVQFSYSVAVITTEASYVKFVWYLILLAKAANEKTKWFDKIYCK